MTRFEVTKTSKETSEERKECLQRMRASQYETLSRETCERLSRERLSRETCCLERPVRGCLRKVV